MTWPTFLVTPQDQSLLPYETALFRVASLKPVTTRSVGTGLRSERRVIKREVPYWRVEFELYPVTREQETSLLAAVGGRCTITLSTPPEPPAGSDVFGDPGPFALAPSPPPAMPTPGSGGTATQYLAWPGDFIILWPGNIFLLWPGLAGTPATGPPPAPVAPNPPAMLRPPVPPDPVPMEVQRMILWERQLTGRIIHFRPRFLGPDRYRGYQWRLGVEIRR